MFTIPKPFTGPARVAQLNALRTWRALGTDLEILVLGDEEGAAEAAAEVGARHVPTLERTEWGTPLVSDAFAAARRVGQGETLCYANAALLFLPDLPAAVARARRAL